MTNNFEVRTKIWKEGKIFIIEAIDFPLVTQGNTFIEAINNFGDAFRLSLQDNEFRKNITKFTKALFYFMPVLPYVELNILHAKTTSYIRQRTN